jgi:hypothetical protein
MRRENREDDVHRWVFVLASILLAAGCGGDGPPSAPAHVVNLPDGQYLLAVYSSGIGCLVSTFGQGAPPVSSVSIPVAVAAEGDKWHVAARDASAGSLAMSLSPSAVGVDGAAWGTLTQPGVSVTLQHQVSGTPNGPSAGVVGSVAGTVNYAGSTGTAFCSTNLWSLTRD